MENIETMVTFDEVIENAEIVLAPGTVGATGTELELDFQPANFVDSLGVMGIGMLGIFIVMGAIILSVVALNKITSRKSKKND